MGVIFGYISLNNNPIDPSVAEKMRIANSFWVPDGEGMHNETHAAIGSLIMYNTPEAIYEKQPILLADGNHIMVATARIDNRDELCRNFNIPLSARDYYPDSYYIKLAFEKWGEHCPNYLLGDWSFAVYNKTTRKLFIARDQHGIMACYYYQGPDFFVFSSSIKGILCLPQVKKEVNEYKIAQLLVNWNEGGPQTCFQNTYRLPPSHTLTIKNGNITTNRYWNLENTPELRLKNENEYLEMFRELYTEAVRCRLRSYRPVGATLSGGLDSGSVCILASQELAKYGKRLPAFTAVPMYDVPWPKNRIGDEGPLALALADKLGNVDVTLCKAENISPMQGVEMMLEVHDQPDFLPINAFWLTEILILCYQSNIGTLLIGQNGNNTVTWKYKKPDFNSTLKRILKSISHYFLNSNNDFFIDKKIIRYHNKKHYQIWEDFVIKKARIKAINRSYNNLHRWYANGLYYKIEPRDPTFDHRLVQFYYKIIKYDSFQLFTKQFQNFFLLDIVHKKTTGVQSVDAIKRLTNNNFENYKSFAQNSLNDYLKYSYINTIKTNFYQNNIMLNKMLRLKISEKFIKTYEPPPPAKVVSPS